MAGLYAADGSYNVTAVDGSSFYGIYSGDGSYNVTVLNSQSLDDMSTTWNDAGTTFTAIKMNVTDTASAAASLLMDLQVGGTSLFHVTKAGAVRVGLGSAALPSYSFSQTNYQDFGFYAPDDNVLALSLGGNRRYQFSVASDSGLQLSRDYVFGWSDSSTVSGSPDLVLRRDAANVLAQRNGVNQQAFRIYNTYTDASNYERANLAWGSNEFVIDTTAAGTGTARVLRLRAGSELVLGSNGVSHWRLLTSGSIIANNDNTYDIGASGTSRPRNIYVGTNVDAAGIIAAGNGTSGVPSFNFRTTGVDGFYLAAAGSVGVVLTGAHRIRFNASVGITLRSDLNLQWSSTTDPGGTADTILARDAANVLAQRNGTLPQFLRIYNTYTDASNYERLNIGVGSNIFAIGTAHAGTGVARPLNIGTAGSAQLQFYTNGTIRWNVNASGHLLAEADNTYDIGASGATRPRNVYIAGILEVTGSAGIGIARSSTTYLNLNAGNTAASSLRIPSGAAPTAPVNGDIWSDGTDLLIRLGGVSYKLDKTAV